VKNNNNHNYKAGPYVRREGLALSMGPIWLGFLSEDRGRGHKNGTVDNVQKASNYSYIRSYFRNWNGGEKWYVIACVLDDTSSIFIFTDTLDRDSPIGVATAGIWFPSG
jgi:hypothetical protein